VLTPIDIDEHGNILDGHNRFRAWRELEKIEPPPTIVRAGLNELAIGQICDLFEPAECRNYFAAAGYGFT
jgi:hypothetical protein